MYHKFFGFSEKPFNLTPDPKFIYMNPVYQEAWASLYYGVTERKGLISVIGEVGTGKTSLLYHLMNCLESNIKPVFVFTTNIGFKELLQLVMAELGLPIERKRKVDLILSFRQLLINELEAGRNVALLIDEAQNLREPILEELRLLSCLETAKAKLLQIILVGQPELETKLNSPQLRQLRQRIAINCYLPPLNKEEVQEYIAHRIKVVGYEGPKLFSRGALDRIYDFSKGIPRLVNIICDNSLLIAYGLEKRKISDGIVEEAIKDFTCAQEVIAHSKGAFDIAGFDYKRRKKNFSMVSRVLIASFLVIAALGIFWGRKDIQKIYHNPQTILPSKLTTEIIRYKEPQNDAGPLLNSKKEEEKPFRENGGVYVDNLAKGMDLFHQEFIPTPEKVRLNNEAIADGEKNFSEKTVYRNMDSDKGEINNEMPVKGTYKERIVRKGEKLSILAAEVYEKLNYTILDIIKMANPGMKDIDLIYEEQKIIFPQIDLNTMIMKDLQGKYAVLVLSVPSMEKADIYKMDLESKGYQIHIDPVSMGKNLLLYRIMVGAYKSKEEALEIAREIKGDNLYYGQEAWPGMIKKPL